MMTEQIRCVQEVGPVSPMVRGNREVVESPHARDLLRLLGLGLLLLGGLAT
jgi:hypothetical protein